MSCLSCRNWKFLTTGGSCIQFLFFFLSLCACFSQVHGDIVPLIHNGVEAQPGKWPWHATLFIRDGLCGGSFIDKHTILTAAHCAVTSDSVRREKDILVFGGRKYRDATTKDMQELNVAKIVIHPEYSSSTYANDIAILQLTSDINITNYVRPVSIRNADGGEKQICESQGTVIGFGLDADDEESDTLQQATLPVLDTQTCLAYDNETYGSHLTSNMYCAGGKDNVSACNGDSGGGMFYSINGTWHLRGIVSFSPTRPNVEPPVCDSSKPTVFTDVTKYRKWISRYTNRTTWVKDLKPCKDDMIEKDTECNAASRFDYVFLLAIKYKKIIRVPLNGDPLLNICDVGVTGSGIKLDYDCADGRFYWTDYEKRTIRTAKYDGTNEKSFITKDRIDAGSLAVDWISRRLYWVDKEKKTIEVASLNNPDLQTTVVANVLDYDTIVVDPLYGKLYRTGLFSGLISYNLDGSEPELSLNNVWFHGMKISKATGEVCFINNIAYGFSEIKCIDTLSKQSRTIISNVTGSLAMDITDDMIYWDIQDSDTIASMNLQGEHQELIKYNSSDYVYSLNAVSRLCPVFYSPCAIDNGDCPENTICLLNPRALSGKICKRIDGQTDLSTIINSKPIQPIMHGGMVGKEWKWPWHAAIYSLLINNTGYLCGGSIINKNTVITAADCFYYNTTTGYRLIQANEISVRGGSKYVDGITEATQVTNVARIIIHPAYNYSNLANDIAILKLSSDFNATNFVRPVSIWSMDSDQKHNVGTQGTVIGFGMDEEGEPFGTVQEANVTVLDAHTCLKYNNLTYGSHSISNMFCAVGSNSKKACNGDAGGSMYFYINGTWFLRGVVSFNVIRPHEKPFVCDGSKPTVFTDVTKYRNWILKYTNRTKWLQHLEPCKDDVIVKDTECDAASYFEYGLLVSELLSNGKVSIKHMTIKGDTGFTSREIVLLENFSVIDYDCVGGRIYWIGDGNRSIISTKHDGTDTKVFITRDFGLDQLAVDWISRRLYWIDKEKETIEAASLDNPDLYTTVTTNVFGLDSIAVDPLEGKLYRTIGDRGIVSHNLDGSEREHLLKVSDETDIHIRDLKVSMATGELCFINDRLLKTSVECIDTRNKQTRTIVSNLTNPIQLALTKDMIYWMDDESDAVKSLNHHGDRQPTFKVYGTTNEINFLNGVTGICPVFYSPCAIDNGECSWNEICLANPRILSGKICKCTKGCNFSWFSLG